MSFKETLSRLFIKWKFTLAAFLVRLRAKYGQVSIIKNKILTCNPFLKKCAPPILPELTENVGNEVLTRLGKTLNKKGDYDCLINGYFSLTGRTSSCGQKSKKLSEVIKDSKLYGAAFWNAGLRKGDTVHFAIPNNTEYYCMAIGVWLCEAINSCADPGLSATVLKTQFEDTNAKFVICYEGSRKRVYETLVQSGRLEKTTVIVLEKSCPDENEDQPITEEGFTFVRDFLEDAEKLPQPPLLQDGTPKDDETHIIFWSSGTTGLPKGIQHPNRNFRYQLAGLKESSGSTSVTTTCFFHGGGFTVLTQLMASPRTIVFNHGGDIDNDDTCELLYKEIDRFKPIWCMFGSHHFVLMSKQKPKDTKLDLSSVVFVSPMGSTVPQTLYEDLKSSFSNLATIFAFYGMTEMWQLVTLSFDVTQLGFVGWDVEVKIVDPETEELLGPNQVGEIMVKSIAVMKGYLNRPGENKKFFGKNGFVHTGDLASYSKNGMLKYEGRHKELIKYKNHHIYPLEIENIICTHPDVIEAAVFGRPEPTVQELVTAVVIKAPNSNISEQDIIELVESQVDDSRRLRGGVIFADALPKNSVGKIQRKKLIELYEEMQD